MERDPNIMPDMKWHPIERLCKIGRFIADRFYSDVPHVMEVQE